MRISEMNEQDWIAAEKEHQAMCFRRLANVKTIKGFENAGIRTIADLIQTIKIWENDCYEKIGDCPQDRTPISNIK